MAKRENDGETVEVPGGPGIPPTTTRRDPSQPATFGGMPTAPYVDPSIVDPAARAYAESMAGRKRVPIPRYADPVAGGADVPIPPLNSEAVGGLTMAQQAEAVRAAMPRPHFAGAVTPPVAPAPSGMPIPSGIVTGGEHLAPPPLPPRSGGLVPPGGLTPADILPDTARSDPMFRQGQGSNIAMNQPELAYKYGVMRNGQFIAPQTLKNPQSARPAQGRGQPQAQLSPDTVEGLAAIQRLNSDRQRLEGAAAPDRTEAEAVAGPAGAAGATRPALSSDEKKNLLDEMDDFDITRLRNALYKDLLNNDEQKRIIEERLRPLDLSDLIMTGRVTQVVPIVPGKFEPEFQSYGGDEDLYVKRMLGIEMENLKPMNGTLERYVTDKYSVMGLTVSVKSINKQQFPSIYDASGMWNEELFWKKYEMVSKFNYHMIGSLIVNWFWFDLRVRHLFKAEALGNG